MSEYDNIINTIKDLERQMEEAVEAFVEHEIKRFEAEGAALYFKISEPDDDEQVVFFKATNLDEDSASYDGTEIILNLTTNETTMNANTSYDVQSLINSKCTKEEFDAAYQEMYIRIADSLNQS